MPLSNSKGFWTWPRILGVGLLIVVIASSPLWWPAVSSQFASQPGAREDATASEHDDHSGHDHDHAHDEANSLELSPQARLNLGLTPEYVQQVKLQTFRRTVAVPAVVASRPGRTHLQVSTPLTGVVHHVHAVTGETVEPGMLLFELRLTHEDLVSSQTTFLQTLGELEVENREISRLEKVTDSGAIAGKTLLERQYARDKLQASLSAQREALKLHGLSDQQVDEIAETRRLLSELQIVAPHVDEHPEDEQLRLTGPQSETVALQETASSSRSAPLLVVEQLDVHKGQWVEAGEQLCTLADYSRLYIEGHAFEQDWKAISRMAERGWTMSAVFDDEAATHLEGLKLAYASNAVDQNSRTLSFFVDLPNEVVRDQTNSEGQRFVTWKYRPGHRLQLMVPVEEWTDQIVVPVDAVAREGAESFVFADRYDHFERISVHVKYRDRQFVVIAHDGSLKPGARIAMRSAHQMQLALKNKSGGPVDPHAGHQH